MGLRQSCPLAGRQGLQLPGSQLPPHSPALVSHPSAAPPPLLWPRPSARAPIQAAPLFSVMPARQACLTPNSCQLLGSSELQWQHFCMLSSSLHGPLSFLRQIPQAGALARLLHTLPTQPRSPSQQDALTVCAALPASAAAAGAAGGMAALGFSVCCACPAG